MEMLSEDWGIIGWTSDPCLEVKIKLDLSTLVESKFLAQSILRTLIILDENYNDYHMLYHVQSIVILLDYSYYCCYK